MESFESFNAVIRSKSIHSNCLSPSRDIAVGFAHNHRVHHLISGGRHLFRDNEQSRKYLLSFKSLTHSSNGGKLSIHAGEAGIWYQVSSAAVSLSTDLSVARHMRTADKVDSRLGTYDTISK